MYPSVCPSPTPNPLVCSLPQPSLFPLLSPLARRRPLLTESIRASLHLSSHHISPSPPPPALPGSLSTAPSPLQLSSALMFDAVHVVVGAVRELNRSQEIGVKPLSCTSPQIWQHGTSLMNYLRMVNTRRALPLPKNIIPSICVQARSRFLLRFGGNYRTVSHLCVSTDLSMPR